MKVDPNSTEYDTFLWKAAEKLNVKFVITGKFVFQAQRLIINANIYDVALKLPIDTYQARDIFVTMDNAMAAIRPIGKKLKGYFIKE